MATQLLKDKIKNASSFSGVSVPILIVLLATFLVWGIGHLLQNSKDYTSLVEELQHKSFGNRWVAAFELSKYLSSSRIPQEDIPWLVQQLEDLYQDNAEDERTRHFLILAAGSLKNKLTLPLIEKSLSDQDVQVAFAGLTSLGQFSEGDLNNFDWSKVKKILASSDDVAVQTAIAVVALHGVTSLVGDILPLLQHQSVSVRYAAAIGLLYLGNISGLHLISEILFLAAEKRPGFSELQIEANKLNVITAATKYHVRYGKLPDLLTQNLLRLLQDEKNVLIKSKTQELLLLLKK